MLIRKEMEGGKKGPKARVARVSQQSQPTEASVNRRQR